MHKAHTLSRSLTFLSSLEGLHVGHDCKRDDTSSLILTAEFECFSHSHYATSHLCPHSWNDGANLTKKKMCKETLISFFVQNLSFCPVELHIQTAYLVPKHLTNNSFSSFRNCPVSMRAALLISLPHGSPGFRGEDIGLTHHCGVGERGFLTFQGWEKQNQCLLSFLPTVPWPEKSGLLFDFYCPKWEKGCVFELEENFTDWVIQVYSLIFLRRSYTGI